MRVNERLVVERSGIEGARTPPARRFLRQRELRWARASDAATFIIIA